MCVWLDRTIFFAAVYSVANIHFTVRQIYTNVINATEHTISFIISNMRLYEILYHVKARSITYFISS